MLLFHVVTIKINALVSSVQPQATLESLQKECHLCVSTFQLILFEEPKQMVIWRSQVRTVQWIWLNTPTILLHLFLSDWLRMGCHFCVTGWNTYVNILVFFLWKASLSLFSVSTALTVWPCMKLMSSISFVSQNTAPISG